MKDYLDELLDYYDIERTDKEGIWIQTKDGNIIPFDYNKGDGKMSNKIRIKKWYVIDVDLGIWKWNFEILDENIKLKDTGYEILPYKNNTEYIYIKYYDNGTYRLWDTGQGLSERDIEELQRYIDEDINNKTIKYYYIYIPMYSNNAILDDRDNGTVVDKQRKAMGNYFKTYKQAKQVWDRIKQILKESKEDEKY